MTPQNDGIRSPHSAHSPRAKRRRWARRVALGLVLIPLLWLLGINLALSTGLVATLVSGERDRSTIELRYDRAWCVWPTTVHVRGLALAIDGARWQLDLRLPEGRTDIDLYRLLSRRFETTEIRGRDAILYFSFKKPHGTDESELKGFHRIDESMPPPILDPEPRPTPDNPWEIELGGVDVHTAKLQVNAIEMSTDGRMAGRLGVRVTERFELPSLTLQINDGDAHYQQALIAESVNSRIALTLAPYNPQELQGPAALRMLSGHMTIEAAMSDLQWVHSVAPDLPVSLHQGRGPLEGTLRIVDGALAADSHLDYQTEQVEARIPHDFGDPWSLRTQATIGLSAQTGSERPAIGLDAVLKHLTMSSRPEKSSWMTAQQLTAAATVASVDLVEGLGPMTKASATLPQFTISDLAQLGTIGKQLTVKGGTVAGRAAIEQHDKPGVFGLDFAVDVDGISMAMGSSNSIHTDGYIRSKGTIDHDDFKLTFDPLHAKLHNTSLRSARGQTSGDWLKVERATVSYHRAKHRLMAELSGQIVDLRSVLAHLRPGEDIFQRVPRLGMGSDPLQYSMSITHTPQGTDIDIDRLQGPPIELQATASIVDGVTRAAVYFRRARVGLRTSSSGARNLEVAVRPTWLKDVADWVHPR